MKGESTRLTNVLSSAMVGGIVAGVVAILDAPSWAEAGVAFLAYLIVLD